MKINLIFILFLMTAATIGCTQMFDPIVGSWQYANMIQLTFQNDGSFYAVISIFGIPMQLAGTWKNIGQNRYQINYYDPMKKQNTVEYLTYDPNSKTLYFGENQGFPLIKTG